MANSNSTFIDPSIPLVSIFDLRGMMPSSVERLVPLMNPQFQRPVITKLVDHMKGSTVQEKTGNRLFKVYRQPNDYPSATVDSRTASGSDLILTFTDTAFQALPVGHQVTATTGALAEIIFAQAGTITVQFLSNSNGNTSFVAGDFAVDTLASDSGTFGNVNNRSNPATVFTLPIEYDNVIGRFDAGCAISFEDANNLTYLDTPYGKAYAMQKEMQTIQRMYQQYYAYMMRDNAMVQSQNRPLPSSWINQIKTMGGFQQSFAGALSLQELRDAVREYEAQGGFSGEEIVVTCGSQYLGDVQESLEPYVITSGTANVVGGDTIKGLNITMYAFEGLVLKFIKDPFLDNKMIFGTDPNTGFSKRSRSAIWMSTDMVKTENGGTLPFVTDYYFGNTADVHRWEVQGSMDSKGNPVSVGSNSKTEAEVNFYVNKTTQLMNPAGCMYHAN